MTSKFIKRYQSPYEIAFNLAGSSGFNKEDVGWDIVICPLSSNTVGYGQGLDPRVDIVAPRVWQQATTGTHAGRIIPAADPLSHREIIANCIGSPVGFGQRIVQHLPLNRRILIIPAAFGGIGYNDNEWKVNGAYYTDTRNRVNALVAANPRNRVFCILTFIHGGNDVAAWVNAESEVKANALEFFNRLRSQINTAANAPILIGGLTDASATVGSTRAAMNAWYRDVFCPTLLPRSAYVSPIGAPANPGDSVHFDAVGQRLLQERFYAAMLKFL